MIQQKAFTGHMLLAGELGGSQQSRSEARTDVGAVTTLEAVSTQVRFSMEPPICNAMSVTSGSLPSIICLAVQEFNSSYHNTGDMYRILTHTPSELRSLSNRTSTYLQGSGLFMESYRVPLPGP